MSTVWENKCFSVARQLVEKLELDLTGITLITECASKEYSFTPIMALLAGANVYALGRDTRYGKFSENKDFIAEIAKRSQRNSIQFEEKDKFYQWNEGDVITNSGMLRPLTEEIISKLKPTAVIPLMWETWEFRSEEVDLSACQKYNIPLIGTNEKYPLAYMYEYPGLMSVKAFFDMGVDVANTTIAVIGGGMAGVHTMETFEKLRADVIWFTPTGKERQENCFSYNQLSDLLNKNYLDGIVFMEHADPQLLIGKDTLLRFEQLKEKFPDLSVVHVCGNIEANELYKSGLNFYPPQIAPFGFMSFLPNVLGPRPVLTLAAAGLKVGEIAARARMSGKSIEETISKTVTHGIGMDFQDGFMNFKTSVQKV